MNYLPWNLVCGNQLIPESFIETHKNHVDWDLVSKYQTLSEWFMIQYMDRLAWELAFMNQDCSIEFVRLIAHCKQFKTSDCRCGYPHLMYIDCRESLIVAFDVRSHSKSLINKTFYFN